MRLITTLCVAVIIAVAPTAAAQTPVLNPANNHIYLETAPGLNILVARAQAAAVGGYLVTINDAAENAFVAANFPGTHWIGLSDFTTEGVYEWDNGEPVTYTNWCMSEPMGPTNHDFVEINGVCPGGWNDINATGVAVSGIIEIPSVIPLYQTNSGSASMDVDGILSGGYSAAIATKCTGATSNVNFGGGLVGNGWDMGYQFTALVPGTVGAGFTTPGGQVVNLVLTQPMTFLNGGVAPDLFTTSFSAFTLPIAMAMPLTASGQTLVANVGNPDGFSLTQGCQINILAGTPTTQVLSLGDDASALVAVGPPLCGFGGVSLLGTVYTDFFVNSNGFVSFTVGSGDFTATVAEFAAQMPRACGMWTDLSPNISGTIQVVPNANDISVEFMNVPEFGASGNTSSFDIVFDDTGGLSINNYAPSPSHGTSTLVGIGNGAGGVTGTPISFATLAGAGLQVTGSPQDAVFEFAAGGAVPVGWTTVNWPASDGSIYSIN